MSFPRLLAAISLPAALAAACAASGDDDGTLPPPGDTPYAPGGGALLISDPALAVDGYTIWLPEQKQGHPEAGEPWYVYLAIGSEGVALPGPSLAELPTGEDESEIYVLDQPSMTWEVIDQSTQGLTVVVNSRLSYRFEIDDFEEELSVARVDLTLDQDGLHSRFVLIADGCNGVAHQASIVATVDGVPAGAPTTAWTIETRGPANGPGCSW